MEIGRMGGWMPAGGRRAEGRGFGACLCMLLIAGCASAGMPELADGPPLSIPRDLSRLPDPVPVTEPKSATGNPPSYQVMGRTYHVLDSAAGFEQVGLASWYGRKFHGRRTSSGEPYDMLELTAAHTSLPIPTYVEVTNLDNQRRAIVRVNDRGPFHDDRIIDLSYAAAVKLGFAELGTARVRVLSLEGAPEIYLQLDPVPKLAEADRLREALRELTGKPAQVVRTAEDPAYRVQLGPLDGEQEAKRLQALLTAADYGVPAIHWR